MPENKQFDSKFELITSLYDPHVVINWRGRPSASFPVNPYIINIHLLKSGAGDVLGQLFPNLTGNDRSRAIIAVTGKITKRINELIDTETHSAFTKKCRDTLYYQLEGRKPAPSELYDYNATFTKDLKDAGFMPTLKAVEDVVIQMLNDNVI
ncbi:MAG: hypothetical protein NC489_08280 [Ruminococcus flavefaciens]|nr:hypothetical protein [Ruminococcus flavefaciens]